MAQTEAVMEPQAKKDRSPNYPQITFTAALGFARKIWDQEKKHLVGVDVALKHMGYNSKNGRSLANLSALRKYGLIVYEGNGLRITDDAAAIFVFPVGSPERESRISELAMLPPLFKEIIKKFPGGLPSDANLSARLQTEWSFTQEAANTVIRALRHSVGLAAVDNGLAGRENREDSNPQESSDMTPAAPVVTGSPPPPVVAKPVPPPVPAGENHSWALGGNVRAHLTITGELRPKNIKLLKQYVDLLAAASEEEEEEK